MTLTGEHIRTARQLLGWSQLALALRAGVGINQLRNFESEVTAPAQRHNRSSPALPRSGQHPVHCKERRRRGA